MIITDRSMAKHPLQDIARAAFRAGARWISVREKDLPFSEQLALVEALEAVAPAGAVVGWHGDDPGHGHRLRALHLSRNGDLEVARHIVDENCLIGKSCHSGEALKAAAAAGVDYATLSPVFASESKPGYGPALGIDQLAALCRLSPIPVIALAGVTAGNAADCMAAGAGGVAVMGEVMRADDPGAIVRDLLAAIGTPADSR